MGKASVKGSYTIEAALILPGIFFVIIGLIYLGFYMHDKIRLQVITNETLIKGKAFIRNEAILNSGSIVYEDYYERGILYCLNNDLKDKEEKIKTYIRTRLERGFFITSIKKINVTASQSELSVEIIAQMKFPFLGIQQFFLDSGTTVLVENKIQIQNTAEFIRIFDVFLGVTEKMEAVDTVLKKLQEILVRIR